MALVVLVAGPVGVAMAAGGIVTIESPHNSAFTNNPTYLFKGLAGLGEEEEGPITVTLAIYSGTAVTSTQVVQTQEIVLPTAGTWALAAAPALANGTYTAQATESAEGLEIAESKQVTFTVDTTPPTVTLSSPANGSSTTSESQSVAGSAGVEAGDASTVTVQLFTGSTVGSLRESHTATVSNATWSDTFFGLSPGTYTVQAEQTDLAGNVGVSAPVTFTVTTPPPPPTPPPPTASFTWFPTAPKTGEDVALLSSSTDMVSPITGWAWALLKPGVFAAGKPLLTTSFSTPGIHTVQLQVTAANGLSSTATESIYVSSAPLVLMQPFPIVRIAGSETYSGVNLRLLSAQAPAGSHITVTCKGHGCPAKSVSKVATVGKRKGSVATVEFSRFERSLPAGVVLEIRIFKAGQIGKFTRFTVRRDKLPERADSCLGPTGAKPIVCPSS